MNLCSEGHDEICFDGRICPLCDKVSEMEKTISSLESTIEELNREISEYGQS